MDRININIKKNISHLKTNNIEYDYTDVLKETYENNTNTIKYKGTINNFINENLNNITNYKSTYNSGLFILNPIKAIYNEEILRKCFISYYKNKNIVYKSKVAFKCNHSLILQEERLKNDINSGIEIASISEAILVISLGFKAENILYANTNINERDFIILVNLGISFFVYDSLVKLENICSYCKVNNVNFESIFLLLRIFVPFGSPSINFDRFGLDIKKNKKQLFDIINIYKNYNLKFSGIAFHVGIGNKTYIIYENIFEDIKYIFNMCYNILGYFPYIINVGGGLEADKYGTRYFSIINTKDQIKHIMYYINELIDKYNTKIEIWTEFGRSYIQSSGFLLTKIDTYELRDNPSKKLQSIIPHDINNAVTSCILSNNIRALKIQILNTILGKYTVPIKHIINYYPEIYEINNKKVDILKHKNLIPTVICGKSCDSSDYLNPLYSKNNLIHYLLPMLENKNNLYYLKINSAAYIDIFSSFNGYCISQIKKCYIYDDSFLNCDDYYFNILNENLITIDNKDYEIRRRVLSINSLTFSQIIQAKKLISEQFWKREVITSFLKKIYIPNISNEIAYKEYIKNNMEDAINNGTGMVNLLIEKNSPDIYGDVISAIYGTIYNENNIPTLPIKLNYIKEIFNFRFIFELEAIIIRNIYTLNGKLLEKIFPMYYISMLATREERIETNLNYNFDIFKELLYNIQGTENVKSGLTIATSYKSNRIMENLQKEDHRIYKICEIKFKDMKIYNTNIFKDIDNIIYVYLIDLRGPFKDKLPELYIDIDISDFHSFSKI